MYVVLASNEGNVVEKRRTDSLRFASTLQRTWEEAGFFDSVELTEDTVGEQRRDQTDR